MTDSRSLQAASSEAQKIIQVFNQGDYVLVASLITKWAQKHLQKPPAPQSLFPTIRELAEVYYDTQGGHISASVFGQALYDTNRDRLLRMEANHIIKLFNLGYYDHCRGLLKRLADLEFKDMFLQYGCFDVTTFLRSLSLDLGLPKCVQAIDRTKFDRRIIEEWSPEGFNGTATLRTLSGPTALMINREDCIIAEQIQKTGSYEPMSGEIWCSLIGANDEVWDIGANTGVYALLAAKVNRAKKVHAFEVNPDVIDRLRENIIVNAASNIVVHEKAASDHNGRATFRFGSPEVFSKLSTTGSVYENRDQTVKIEVETVTLDDLFTPTSGKNILAKIDTEGAEVDVLNGMNHWIENNTFDFMIESFIGDYCEEITRRFAPMGYRFYFINEGEYQLHETKTMQAAIFDNRHNFNSLITKKSPEDLRKLLPTPCQIIERPDAD